jgi:hypothetical protein
MKRWTIAAALGALLVVAGCGTAGGNPVVGKWQSVQADCEATTQMEYTANEYAGFEGPNGVYPGWHRVAVSYVASATEVWVEVNGAFSNKTRVLIIDANHIKPDDGYGCVFQRVG